MIDHRFTRTLAPSALAATLVGSIVTSAQAVPLPVTSVQDIAGAAATEQVQWWGGRGWGWRRSYYGGGALAAGLIGGLALGTLAASAGSYYGYGYPYYGYSYPSYYGSGYGYYPSSYAYPAYSYGYYPSSYAYHPITPIRAIMGPLTMAPRMARVTETPIGLRASGSVNRSASTCAVKKTPRPPIRGRRASRLGP
jgi:hypothetical protein